MVIGDSMTTQNYCLVDLHSNICDNVVLWDGDTNTWTPPADHIALVQATTPAKVWGLAADKTNWELIEVVGDGQIGFTWDGTFLVTNEPQPQPVVQPKVEGAQTL